MRATTAIISAAILLTACAENPVDQGTVRYHPTLYVQVGPSLDAIFDGLTWDELGDLAEEVLAYQNGFEKLELALDVADEAAETLPEYIEVTITTAVHDQLSAGRTGLEDGDGSGWIGLLQTELQRRGVTFGVISSSVETEYSAPVMLDSDGARGDVLLRSSQFLLRRTVPALPAGAADDAAASSDRTRGEREPRTIGAVGRIRP